MTGQMMDSQTNRSSEAVVPACAEKRAAVRECVNAARDLLDLLSRETGLLRRFASHEILELLPHKQFAVVDLAQKLQALLDIKGPEGEAGQDEGRAPLRAVLAEIDRVNRTNRTFIEGSLEFWHDFMGVFVPAAYGPGQTGTQKKPTACKGFSFSREV